MVTIPSEIVYMVFAGLIGILSFLDGSKLKNSLLGVASEFYKINEQVQNTVYSILNITQEANRPLSYEPLSDRPPHPEVNTIVKAIKAMTEELKTEQAIIIQKINELQIENGEIKSRLGTLEETVPAIKKELDSLYEEEV